MKQHEIHVALFVLSFGKLRHLFRRSSTPLARRFLEEFEEMFHVVAKYTR
jgi:hypothetical protein